MTLLDLITYLRNNILHDNGGTGVDWTSYSADDFDSMQLRWTNEEITANINEAITQVYRRTNPIKDLYTIDVVTGTSEYSIPEYIQNILLVKNEIGTKLAEKEIIELWWDEQLDTQTGDLVAYIVDLKNKTIKFLNIPVKDETVTLLVYRYPKTQLSWDSYDDSPELASQYQIPMLWYAAGLCYLKEDANTLDPKRSDRFMAMFDREFPFTSVYSNIRKGRTNNRAIKYGGL